MGNVADYGPTGVDDVLSILTRTHLVVIGISLETNFDDVLSVLTRNSKAAVQHINNLNLVKQEERSCGRKQ